MKKRCRVLSLVVIVVMTIVMAIGVQPVEKAQAKSKNAYEAYKAYLNKSSISWGYTKAKKSKIKFALAFVDSNATPELIIYNPDAISADGFYHVYTYKKGKVRYVCSAQDGFKYFRKKAIFTSYRGHMGYETTTYLRLKKGKSKVLMGKVKEIGAKTTYFKGKNHKDIKAKTFNKKKKKLIGKRSATKPKYYKNTKANREGIICKQTLTGLNYSEVEIYPKESFLVLKAKGITFDKVTWRSTNKKVATVDKNSRITAKKAGTCYIKAKYGKKTKRCKVIVKKEAPKFSDAQLATIKSNLNVPAQLDVTAKQGKASWIGTSCRELMRRVEIQHDGETIAEAYVAVHSLLMKSIIGYGEL